MTTVSQFMTDQVITCRPTDTLHHAAHLMWDRDVGCLPVIDDDGRLLGLITDRDVAMGAYRRDERLREVFVREGMTARVYACGPDDDLREVQATMTAHRVRRLPVVDASGFVLGIVSLDDLARAATAHALPVTELVAAVAVVAGSAAQPDPDC